MSANPTLIEEHPAADSRQSGPSTTSLAEIAKRLLTASCAAALAGCALIDPYVAPEAYDGQRGESYYQCPQKGTALTLPASVECAKAWRQTYRDALGTHATLNGVTGIGLITLTSAALGIGATNGADQGSDIAWLGVTSAAWLGISNWLSSPPRERAYIAGQVALGCAIDAVDPLLSGSFDESGFDSTLQELNALTSELNWLLAQFDADLAAYTAASANAARYADWAQSVLSSVRPVPERAAKSFTEGMALLAKRRGAAQTLLNTVEKIATQVDDLVQQTVPNLQALPNLINGLAQTSAQLTTMPTTSGVSGMAAGATEDQIGLQGADPAFISLRELAATLFEKSAAVESLTRWINGQINGVAAATPDLASCGVDRTAVSVQLSVVPEGGVTLKSSQDATRGLIIKGGKPPYAAELLEAPLDNLSVTQPVAFGPKVSVTAKAGAPVGTYRIAITDSASAHLIVQVSVLEAGSNSTGRQPGESSTAATDCVPAETARDAFEWGLSDQELFIVQRIVRAEADGKMGAETRAAICAFQRERASQLAVTGRIDQATLDLAKLENAASGGIVEGAANAFERDRDVAPNTVAELQGILGVPQSGELDDATRRAITAFDAPGIRRPDEFGRLNRALWDAIFNSS